VKIELGRIIADQLQRGCELAERIQPADPAFLGQLPFGISDGRREDDEAISRSTHKATRFLGGTEHA
jgi:hypothetical protein